MVTSRIQALACLLSVGTLVASKHTTSIDIPSNPSTRILTRDVFGYSLEPVWVSDFVNTSLARTLLQSIADVTGVPPRIRVGGNTADQTNLVMGLNTTSIEIKNPETVFNVSPAWYDSWASYFPTGTSFIYTLNMRDNSSHWANAQAEAEIVEKALGDKLSMLELGNEIDHFIHKGWRASSWNVETYVSQFRALTSAIVKSSWYREASHPPKFQAGVFADPPWVPDQQDEIDDFDILNLTRAGLADPAHDVIQAYSVHLYPQSTCDTGRWHRMRLDLLSNHTVLWLNVSQYLPQVAAADAANTSLVLGETNSISCSGKSGISDTLGAALWTVDYVLMAAAIGIDKVYFHLGARSEYSAFTPLPYGLKNETVQAGIRANWYAHYFVAKVVARGDGDGDLSIAALPSANSSDLSGYAIYGSGDKGGGGRLKKLVVLDMGVWNASEGLSNPSTLKATDGTVFSPGERPGYNMSITTTWQPGGNVSITRLTGPGTNAKSLVGVSGVTFDPKSGEKQGKEALEWLAVGPGGVLEFRMSQAEGVLLEALADDSSSSGHVAQAPAKIPNAAITLATPWGLLLGVSLLATSLAAIELAP